VYEYDTSRRRTSCLDDVVLFSYSELQSFEVVILVDMDVLMINILALADEVEALDGHNEVVVRMVVEWSDLTYERSVIVISMMSISHMKFNMNIVASDR
jgi:hypothetical protein